MKTYWNGYVVEYVYDRLENLKEIWYTKDGTRSLAYSYEYTNVGQIYKYIDHINGKTQLYKYDANNRLTDIINYDSNEYETETATSISYNDKGDVSSVHNYFNALSSGLKYNIGKILSRYNMAPTIRSEYCTNGNASSGPYIMFTKGGDGVIDTNGDGVNEYDLTNDQFIIEVYSDSGNLILSVNTTNYYYTFSLSQWETIKASCDSSYTICVGGRDTDSYTTGYYYSGPLTYEIP